MLSTLGSLIAKPRLQSKQFPMPRSDSLLVLAFPLLHDPPPNHRASPSQEQINKLFYCRCWLWGPPMEPMLWFWVRCVVACGCLAEHRGEKATCGSLARWWRHGVGKKILQEDCKLPIYNHAPYWRHVSASTTSQSTFLSPCSQRRETETHKLQCVHLYDEPCNKF
jgi:hypothetical protein